jgi:alpha-beta hydrolase superfamily lysophospholipase
MNVVGGLKYAPLRQEPDEEGPLHRTIASALAIGVAVFIAFAGSAGAATEPVKGPKGNAFYKPPKHLPKGHGELIWSRKAKGITPIDGAGSNTLVLYTSETPKGKTTAVSGIVSTPPGKAPKGGWPGLSFAHGTTGNADACAPTRAPADSPQAGYVTYIDPELQAWTEAGYAVVRTDYQGQGTPGPHPYLIGTAEGRSVVDIVTAARRLNADIGKKYLISGHSQGGQSALFAAGLAQKYAPKLKLAGTVAYAPASHIREQADLLPALRAPSGLSALAALIVNGAASQSKAIDVQALLSDQALVFYPQTDTTCLPQLSEPDSFGGMAPADMLRDGADTGPLFKVLEGENPAVTTKPPILLLQGSSDTTVFPFLTDMLNQELVALGDQVTYTTYPGVDHGGIVSAAEAQALEFMQDRLPAG